MGEGDRLAKVKHDYSRDDSRVISVFNSGHFQIFHDTAPALGKGDEIAHIADGGKFYPQGYNIRVVGMKVPVYDPQHPDRNPDCGKAYQRAGVEACPQGKSQTCHRPEPGGGGKAPDLVLAGDQDSASPQKSDATDDLGRNPSGVGGACDFMDKEANHHGEGRTKAHHQIGSKACGPVPFFAFIAQEPSQQHGEEGS